jgi:hypothetical protein
MTHMVRRSQWYADHSGERINIFSEEDNRRVFVGTCSENAIGRRRAEAHARIIAAAPDMLALLERFLAHPTDANARNEAAQLVQNVRRKAVARGAVEVDEVKCVRRVKRATT